MRFWQQRGPVALVLWPLSLLYRLLAAWRRQRAQALAASRPRLAVRAVIVVGNLTVGGTGKTPLVIAVCQWLKTQGFRPGVISRGYGAKLGQRPLLVTPELSPQLGGDEPVLIAAATQCPVMIDADRYRAAQRLLEQTDCDIIVSDDGLQHHALSRDIEIALMDGDRRWGNGFCLPAGPLREPVSRWKTVDMRVVHGGEPMSEPQTYAMSLSAGPVYALGDKKQIRPLNEFSGQAVHAVAGIGHPPRFFALLRKAGLEVREHAFADHHAYTEGDLALSPEWPILMTEKDAVKCRTWAQAHHWVVPVTAECDPTFFTELAQRIAAVEEKKHG